MQNEAGENVDMYTPRKWWVNHIYIYARASIEFLSPFTLQPCVFTFRDR